ncbi:ATP-binding cassette domain-containing protein [Aquincola sp. MAHUQ-54]|uniref:ATP-binding cassette domain-containing protein n=1 Tax=Aquincola agrisoli TaxID=3119538 RepID=A0AAW9QA47_9BURK
MTEVLLAVAGLSVQVGGRPLLREVSFELRAGEALTLLGESGAGKSLLAQAVMGNLPRALRAGGRVTIGGATTAAADGAARRPLWGRALALLPQEPALALDPLARIAPQLAEVHALVGGAGFGQAPALAARQLADIGLSHAVRRYPWQVSGGMAQRAAAAMALAGGARVLMADEPTKGLDAHWRARTVETLQAVQRRGGCVVTITHDLRVAQALGGRLMVLRDGEVVEQGEAQAVLAAPRHPFTRALLAADPAHWPMPAPQAAEGEPVVRAQGLAKRFGERRLFEGIDLALHSRDRLVVQGASGTGKSTLGNVLLGLQPADAGVVRRRPDLPATAFQKLYQDPAASFAPHARLAQSLRDVARRHGRAWSQVQACLDRLRVPESLLGRRPAEVSGGELQRIALARVLTVQPALLFADEPTSRLDPVSQQEAMALLLETAAQTRAALVLVTHDDDIAAAVATQRLSFGEAAAA